MVLIDLNLDTSIGGLPGLRLGTLIGRRSHPGDTTWSFDSLTFPLSLVLQALTMIRFPPTSIVLSESDVNFHLNEIRIKEQLYARGFIRKEVHQYYNQRHGYVNGIDVEGDAPSTRDSSLTSTEAGDDPA
jgi:hypothetical protein